MLAPVELGKMTREEIELLEYHTHPLAHSVDINIDVYKRQGQHEADCTGTAHG